MKNNALENAIRLLITRQPEVVDNCLFNAIVQTIIEDSEVTQSHNLENCPDRNVPIRITKVPDDIFCLMVSKDDAIDFLPQF